MVVDTKLKQACYRAAKKAKLSRSAWVRLALCEHLQRAQILEFEQRDQRGYEIMPQSSATKEFAWEAEAVWPQP